MASAFAQLADFLAKLFAGLYDLLTDIGLARDPQVVVVPALDHDRWNGRNDDQSQYSSGQP